MNFQYTVSSSKTVDPAITALEENLRAAQFGVLWSLDLPAKLQEKGVTFDHSFRILEVCNPHKAKQVLETDLLAGYFLPCKIVVYNDAGVTKIGLVRPTALMDMVENPALRSFAAEVEETLMRVIDESR